MKMVKSMLKGALVVGLLTIKPLSKKGVGGASPSPYPLPSREGYLFVSFQPLHVGKDYFSNNLVTDN
jgi:hypothetical protein